MAVFLRTLEYYTGILFLTTNRVGAFDEAFKSRIHVSLYYPQLVKAQYLKIWRMNLGKTKQIESARLKKKTIPSLIIDDDEIMRYAETHWMENKDGAGRWNGRQIRNAFQTATALAMYAAHRKNAKLIKEDENAEMVPPSLKIQHFQKVARATTQFDEYLEEIVGKDDAHWAHSRGDRADHFDQTVSYADHRSSTVSSNSPYQLHNQVHRAPPNRRHHMASPGIASDPLGSSPSARYSESRIHRADLAMQKEIVSDRNDHFDQTFPDTDHRSSGVSWNGPYHPHSQTHRPSSSRHPHVLSAEIASDFPGSSPSAQQLQYRVHHADPAVQKDVLGSVVESDDDSDSNEFLRS